MISHHARLPRQVVRQSLSVSGKGEFREPFYPLMPGVRFVPYGDADALDKELGICDAVGFDIAAFIVEPVQGEAGAIVPPDDYFPKVREICDKWGILLIADEVQTGMGRTGKLWGMEHWGVAPDIMTMGKALGGAVIPIGNFIATPEGLRDRCIENPYIHTTTFGGNPMATAGGHRRPARHARGGHPGAGGREGRLAQGQARGAAPASTTTSSRRSAAWASHRHAVQALRHRLRREPGALRRGRAHRRHAVQLARRLRMQPPAIITYEQMDQVLERLERDARRRAQAAPRRASSSAH